MHAIDRFRRPRPESVLTSAELAAITTPTIFILGSDDPDLNTSAPACGPGIGERRRRLAAR
jgi:hypothetical protein